MTFSQPLQQIEPFHSALRSFVQSVVRLHQSYCRQTYGLAIYLLPIILAAHANGQCAPCIYWDTAWCLVVSPPVLEQSQRITLQFWGYFELLAKVNLR